MKYRTKLILSFSGIIIATTLLLQELNYRASKKVLISELRSKILAASATTSELIDKEQVATAVNDLNDQAENFKILVQELRNVRDANRRKDFYVMYIYLLAPDPQNPEQMVVVADASQNPAEYAPPGTLYPEGKKIGILDHLKEAFVPSFEVEDRWGRFLPGYAPIYTADGKYLATLGMNLDSKYIDQKLDHLRWVALESMGISLIAGLIVATLLAHGITKSLQEINRGIFQIGKGDLQTRIAVTSKDEFGHLATTLNEMAKGLLERDRLKSNFIRYVSKHVLENILSGERMSSLEGERRKITVMFSDIRDFTRLAEKMPPEDVVSILNEFLAAMLDVVFSHDGTLDKFMGDGIMVEFGAPLDDAKQEMHAVQTAIGMNKALRKLNQKWLQQGRPQIAIGIGIHTGCAVVGNIGSEKRMEYTAVGDTVNIASRLQEATKELKIPILISKNTWEGTQNRFSGKALGPMHLRGRDEPIDVYSVEIV